MSEEVDLRLERFPQKRLGVTLRVLTTDDVDAMFQLHRSPGVYEGLLTIPRKPDRAWSQECTEKLCESMTKGEGSLLLAEHDGEVVGSVGLGIKWKHGHGGLGYLLKESVRGKGIASCMLQMVLDHGFDDIGLNRIWADTFMDNEASRRLLIRNGFVHEGVKRQAYHKEDRYLDVDMWAMLETDPRPWKEQQA